VNLLITDQQKMLKKTARDFLSQRCPKDYVRQMENDEKGYCPKLWQNMADLGWMGLIFPEEHGGSALGFIDLVLLLEEMGRACLPGPFFSTVVLGGLTILNLGSEGQKQELLPQIANGAIVVSLALSEPTVDYSTDHISTTATPVVDSYVINGTKLFVADAHVADYLVCVTKSESGENRLHHLNLFLGDTKSPGITCTLLKTISADKLFEVAFNNFKVPEKKLLGGRAQDGNEVDKILQFASIAKCAEMIGGAQQVLAMTVDYARERVQFGHPIGSFQAIQHHCANMLIDVNASRLIAYQAAWLLSEGLNCTKEVSVAKAWVSTAYRRICILGHQVHGAIGFTKDHDLQLYSRRAKMSEILFGDATYHQKVVAKEFGL